MKNLIVSFAVILLGTFLLYEGMATAQTWGGGTYSGFTCGYSCGGQPRPGDPCSTPGATTTCGAAAGSGSCPPYGSACFHYTNCVCAY